MGDVPLSGAKPVDYANPERMYAEYNSNALRILMEDLNRRPNAQVLDVGPVCGENISFIADRVNRLFICDMYFRFNRYRINRIATSNPWQHLDYPEKNFDVIFLWDLLDRLEEKEAKKVVTICRGIVKPGGMVMLCAQAKQALSNVVNSFVIGTDFRMNLRPQPHLAFPVYYRQNRDIMAFMHPLKLFKSFIYRNGIREFLFRRD